MLPILTLVIATYNWQVICWASTLTKSSHSCLFSYPPGQNMYCDSPKIKCEKLLVQLQRTLLLTVTFVWISKYSLIAYLHLSYCTIVSIIGLFINGFLWKCVVLEHYKTFLHQQNVSIAVNSYLSLLSTQKADLRCI